MGSFDVPRIIKIHLRNPEKKKADSFSCGQLSVFPLSTNRARGPFRSVLPILNILIPEIPGWSRCKTFIRLLYFISLYISASEDQWLVGCNGTTVGFDVWWREHCLKRENWEFDLKLKNYNFEIMLRKARSYFCISPKCSVSTSVLSPQ